MQTDAWSAPAVSSEECQKRSYPANHGPGGKAAGRSPSESPVEEEAGERAQAFDRKRAKEGQKEDRDDAFPGPR